MTKSTEADVVAIAILTLILLVLGCVTGDVMGFIYTMCGFISGFALCTAIVRDN